MPRVHVVDDDPDVVRSIALVLDAASLVCTTWTSPDEFLRTAEIGPGDVVLLDVRMPGRTGPEVQEELLRRHVRAPIVFLSAHGDVPTSVRVVKRGAEDFLLKPVDPEALLEVLRRALSAAARATEAVAYEASLREEYESLTPRERDALARIVAGDSNKVAAAELGITENTMKVHRQRVMEKMRADSLAELVQKAIALGVVPVRGA